MLPTTKQASTDYKEMINRQKPEKPKRRFMPKIENFKDIIESSNDIFQTKNKDMTRYKSHFYKPPPSKPSDIPPSTS